MAKNKKTTITFIALAGILFAALAIGGFLYYRNRVASNTQPTALVVEEDGKPQTEAKERAKQEAAQNSGSPSQTTAVNPQITSIEQDGTTAFIRAIVNNAKSGTCTLKLQKTGQAEVVKTAPLGLVTSYYACQGFNVAKSEIPAKGEWKVVVEYNGEQGSGKAEGTLNVS